MHELRGPTVLHAFPIWLPQTQTWMHSQVSELQQLGAPVHVACESTSHLDQFAVEDLHCLQSEPAWRRHWDLGLRKLGWRHHLDHLVRVGRRVGASVVHSHFGNIGWTHLDAVRRIGARHVVTFYGLDVNKLPMQEPVWRERYGELFRRADRFLCEGSHMAQSLVGLGCPRDKVAVQHLGVDPRRFRYEPRQWRPGQPLRVLIAASFREKKGIPYAIQALAVLRGEVDLELTVIGDAGGDDESRAEKQRILAALEAGGLRDRTRMLGYQPHAAMLEQAYAHHLFLHPSVTAADGDTEGGAPVTITEMLATGMPVVATRHCDIPEVMGPALQHLLAAERDVRGLVEVLHGCLRASAQWAQWTHAGRDRVVEEYDQRIQARRLWERYAELAPARTGQGVRR